MIYKISQVYINKLPQVHINKYFQQNVVSDLLKEKKIIGDQQYTHANIITGCIYGSSMSTYFFLPTDYASGACPRICPPSGEPVCGSDGVIYASQCEMRKKMCGKGKALLIIIVITIRAPRTHLHALIRSPRDYRGRKTEGKSISSFFSFSSLRNTLLASYVTVQLATCDFFIFSFCILTDRTRIARAEAPLAAVYREI